MNKKLKKHTKGFSLVEIIAILAILAVVLVIEAPNIKNYSGNLLLRGTAQDLASDLREAQQHTVTEQTIHSIALDINSNSYNLIREPTTIIKTKILPSGTTFGLISNFTDNKISFNVVGAVTESGIITINSNNNGNSKTINIHPSGYIDIQ